MKRRALLGELLKSSGCVSQSDLEHALLLQGKTGERIGEILRKLGCVREENIVDALAAQYDVPSVELAHVRIQDSLMEKIPFHLMKRYGLIPVSENGGSISVAVADPFNIVALDHIRSYVKKQLSVALAPETEIRAKLADYEARVGAQALEKREEIAERSGAQADSLRNALRGVDDELRAPDAPVVKLVETLILEAFKRRASDVHIEPMSNRLAVRYRIDGVLHEVPPPPRSLQEAMVSRVKIMAHLDIAEKRLPQDGRIALKLLGRDIDFRVSTIPSVHGEAVVLRILARDQLLLPMNELGFSSHDEERWRKLIGIPNGIVLVTGPTGSGKTTTLYTSLAVINRTSRKIITVEDPIEYQLSGVNQVQVKPQIGLTFAAGLRSILRQAPNVILVGEIRDFETAQIAIEAALTGHLVFSTLHTNDAPGAITRLIDMNLKPYLVASSVQAILAQRLVRLICPACKSLERPSREVLEALKLTLEAPSERLFARGKGCEACSFTGYRGRRAIFELLMMTDELREMVYQKPSSTQVRARARELGMTTLREDGLRKVFAGLTTLEEVYRVTQADLR